MKRCHGGECTQEICSAIYGPLILIPNIIVGFYIVPKYVVQFQSDNRSLKQNSLDGGNEFRAMTTSEFAWETKAPL
jgi:hypothetical protein